MFRYLFLLFSLAALTDCAGTKNTNTGDTPPEEDTIQSRCGTEDPVSDVAWIREFAESYRGRTVKAKITRYELDGEYYFEVNNCVNCADAMTVLYTCDHGKKCETGGIAGLQTCGDFYNRAGKGEIVWKNYEDSDRSKY